MEPYKLPYEKEIKNDLHTKQEIVEGYIEYAYRNNEDDVALICNEEGKYLGLPLNRDIGHDIIAGTFILVGDDGSGEDLSLTDEQIEKYKKRFDKESIRETDIAIAKIALSNSYEI